jgi:hypothetical protein
MNKTVVALSVATAFFATTTAYLAYEIHERDAGDAASVGVSGDAAPASRTSAANTAARAGEDTTVLPTNLTPATGSAARLEGVARSPDSKARDVQSDPVAGFARQFLARYDDAMQRPVLLEEQRTTIRRQYEKLKEQLNLGDSAFEQLVTMLAEEQLQGQEGWARCAVDPACDPKNRHIDYVDRTQDYQAMLGTEDAEAFLQYRKSIGERDAVINLRGRLTDSNFLPEAQAEKLIAALAEEREKFSKEAEARGAQVKGWGTNLGMLMYTEDSGVPEQYIAEATQYSQRLRARASSILTPAQLAAYTQIQNELLAMFTSNQKPAPRQNKSTVVRAS